MRFSRTQVLVGEEGVERLRAASVAVVGLGGVGGYALEAVARAGVGHLLLVDSDIIEATNLNRQVLALESTLGVAKVAAARDRVRQINPDARVLSLQQAVTRDNADTIIPEAFDHVIEAIDSLDAKVHLLCALWRRGARFVSCMGAASRLNPTGIEVADISRTTCCPLARAVRHRLAAAGVRTGVRCVFSKENLNRVVVEDPQTGEPLPPGRRRIQGSISFVPGLVGLTAAGIILNDILRGE